MSITESKGPDDWIYVTVTTGWQELEPREVMLLMRHRGAFRVKVEFSGGNDDGGVDRIVLCDENDTVLGTLDDAWAPNSWERDEEAKTATSITIHTEGSRLAEALSFPIYERYHSFAGEFNVTGYVVWDTKTGEYEFEDVVEQDNEDYYDEDEYYEYEDFEPEPAA